jgi:hypothetical protein
MRFLKRLQVFTSDSGMAPQAANCSAPVDTVGSEMIDTLDKVEQKLGNYIILYECSREHNFV